MAKHCPRSGQLFFGSVHHATSRDIIADIQKRITKLQNGAKLPPYSAWVFENSGGLHAHIIFIGDRGGSIAGRLEGSAKFGALLHVVPVTHLRGLTRNYLTKERTPQAGWRRKSVLGGRIKGSHQLEGGGDRVRLSRELERDAVEAGYVQPWQHTNARRSVARKPYTPRRPRHVASAGRDPQPRASERLEARPKAEVRDVGKYDAECAATHGTEFHGCRKSARRSMADPADS